MKMEFNHKGKTYEIDLSKPLDISISLRAEVDNPRAWYVDAPEIIPVRNGQFIGSVREGGSVNFRNIFFNPHGHGTHTECVGHISEAVYSINQVLKRFFYLAELISVEPSRQENGDLVISKKEVESKLRFADTEAIIIRSLPNPKDKLQKNYSNTNPPYMEAAAMESLAKRGILHFLIDLPSVDREEDGGALAAHRAFWEYPEKLNLERTITEFIYVDDEIKDGNYLLNLQIASFENDASPSKPVLYPVVKKK